MRCLDRSLRTRLVHSSAQSGQTLLLGIGLLMLCVSAWLLMLKVGGWVHNKSSLHRATDAAAYITALSTQRGLLGAAQNQIEYSVSNVTELSSNLTAARSNVQDTDYASETAALTKGQILQQAATAMLAQANQMPNVILSLLK